MLDLCGNTKREIKIEDKTEQIEDGTIMMNFRAKLFLSLFPE